MTAEEILATIQASPGDRTILLSGEDWEKLLEEHRTAQSVNAVFDHGLSYVNSLDYEVHAIRFFTPWGTVTLKPQKETPNE